MNILLAHLFTTPLQDHTDSEIGEFELPVEVEKNFFLTASDKGALVRQRIAIHLAQAIHSTKVPSEYWRCRMNKEIAKNLNLPETLSFAVRK